MARTKQKRAASGKHGAQLAAAHPAGETKATRKIYKVVPVRRPAGGGGAAGAPSKGRSKQQQPSGRPAADPATAAAASREVSPPVEQPPAKRRKLDAPGSRQLEVDRTMVCFDSNILMRHSEAAEQAWAAIQAGGGSRVQALVPLKVRHEVRSLAASAGRRDGQPSPLAWRSMVAAKGGEVLLERMMRVVECCRVQREDEQYRRHPRRVAEQRGDDSILDSLLHFQSAQVLLATADRELAERASEHGLTCVRPQQLVLAVQAALAAGQWTAEHDRELALLLFAPGYQQAALGASFPPHTEEAYSAFARRLQQPLQRVLLAATQLLAGSPAAAAAAASCWDGASRRLSPPWPLSSAHLQQSTAAGERQPPARGLIRRADATCAAAAAVATAMLRAPALPSLQMAPPRLMLRTCLSSLPRHQRSLPLRLLSPLWALLCLLWTLLSCCACWRILPTGSRCAASAREG
ncbi:hypothetical protein ABPG75_011021 [Micractinium tetrahymenae]